MEFLNKAGFRRGESVNDEQENGSSIVMQAVDLAAALNQQTDLVKMVEMITLRLAGLLKAENAFLLLINPATRETIRTINRYYKKPENQQLHEIQIHASGWIMRFQKGLYSPNLQQDPRFPGFKESIFSNRSVIGIPIFNQNLIIGSLIMIDKMEGAVFNERDLIILEKIGHIVSPFLNDNRLIKTYFDQPVPENVLLEKYAKLGLIGKSEKFIGLLRAIECAARCDVRVLLEGGSGTGKELIAKAIHRMSDRWNAPFLAIDCGAIPAQLMESELMGYVKGSFTGALADHKGLFEAANHGTLFMDEILNLPLDMQVKLLRILQEGEIRPLGSHKTVKIDVRIIAAASASLVKKMEKGEFREDLFYRLYVYPIKVPSLRERRDDIPLLANTFLEKLAAKQQKKLEKFHPLVMQYLKTRSWPGNVRELQNMIERLVTVAEPENTVLTRNDLPEDLYIDSLSAQQDLPVVEQSLPEKIAAYEADLIVCALEQNRWNQAQTAKTLKIPVQTLTYKIKKLNIVPKK